MSHKIRLTGAGRTRESMTGSRWWAAGADARAAEAVAEAAAEAAELGC